MRPERLRIAVVVGGVALAVAALLVAGTGPLAGPPTSSWPAVERWYDEVGAGAAALAGLRLLALGAAGWILLASVLQLVGTRSSLGAIQRVADAVSPGVLRRLGHGAAGLSVTLSLAGPPGPTDPAGTAIMEVLDDGEPTATTTATTTTPVLVPTPEPAPPPADEVVVALGDSFWSLAADAVSERPGTRSVDDYWRRLIAANRGRLVDPGNPDLLYPGQVLTLPPLDAG